MAVQRVRQALAELDGDVFSISIVCRAMSVRTCPSYRPDRDLPQFYLLLQLYSVLDLG